MTTELWVFGYGSLIWRPGITYHERRIARVRGWKRRFWQGSHDHRGVPDAPGRVVTLLPERGASCEGMAYRIDATTADSTFAGLDHREKNGYERHDVRLEFRDGSACDGVVYIAPVDNFAYLGPAPDVEMVEQIRRSSGPSGANIDYLVNLATALRELAIDDPHVFRLERLALAAGGTDWRLVRPAGRAACTISNLTKAGGIISARTPSATADDPQSDNGPETLAEKREHVERAGGRIAYDMVDHVACWQSPGQTVLFHHGLGACSAMWDAWTPALVDRYRLVRFDMRGHGESPLPRGFDWTLDGAVADVKAVADAVGAQRFHIVGESTGGTVALAVAARHPERVLSVTVLNGAHRGGDIENLAPWKRIIREEGMAAWSAHMMGQRFFDGALTDAMWRWYETQQASADPQAVLDVAEMLVGVDLVPDLERVTCPVLLLHPDSSPFIPVETMAELKRALPDARLRVFARARHGLPFSHVAACAAEVAEFIRGLSVSAIWSSPDTR